MAQTPQKQARRRRLSRPMIIGGAVVGLLLAGFAACSLLPKEPKDPYRLEEVQRGDITRSVSASGTLEALVTVQVGSQISGQITQVLVDFNDQVHRGQTLAILDPQTYTSRIQQGQAEVAASAATVNQGLAGVAQAQAQAEQARAEYNRQKFLFDRGIAAQAALDTAEAAWKSSQASVASARATVGASRARVAQSQAALQSTRVDLSRTRIVAPIDGVIVDRQIEPGQTVAASLQAPVLFQIAQDLSQVEVKILVDEADIGQVREGQAVRFTVDAFPEDSFQGIVTQVRKQPNTENNVVAYVVMAEASNPDGKLLPGMTANADIVMERRRDVLTVPAAALRFTPADQQSQAGERRASGGGQGGGGQGRMGGARLVEQLDLSADQKAKIDPIMAEAQAKMRAGFESGDRAAGRAAMQAALRKIEPLLTPAQKTKLEALQAQQGRGGRGPAGGYTQGTVWVLRENKPVSVPVRVGATDGSNTEIQGDLKEGDEVIVGGGPKAKATAGGSPLAPGSQRGPRVRGL